MRLKVAQQREIDDKSNKPNEIPKKQQKISEKEQKELQKNPKENYHWAEIV